MPSIFKRVPILITGFLVFAVVGAAMAISLSPLFSQPAEAAKCIDDPAGGTFDVALNSVIRDGYLVVDESLAETQPPLHWKYPSIRMTWTEIPGAKYKLRRSDAKDDKGIEYYATKANDAETWLTTNTAVRPNHASALRFWYVDVLLDDGAQFNDVFQLEVHCGQIEHSVNPTSIRGELLTESVGSDLAPDKLGYPRGTWINHSEWNPKVERILAERRAAAAANAPQSAQSATPVPPTPTPTAVPPTATPVPPTPTPTPTAVPQQANSAPLLTAELRNVPSAHDGTTRFALELHFSEDMPGLGYTTVRDSVLQVTNGRVTGARRYAGGSNQAWIITVQPTSSQAIEVQLSATTNCAAADAICLSDGTKLSSGLLTQIPLQQTQESTTPTPTPALPSTLSQCIAELKTLRP